MRILVTIQQFEKLTGTQIVALEACEHFVMRGHACDLVCNIDGAPIRSFARRAGVRVLSDPSAINALDYDLVWAMNHLAPALRYEATDQMVERTFFAFVHTTTAGNLAYPSLVLQPLVADREYANSPETAKFLEECGRTGAAVFYNAAPKGFWDMARSPRRLKSVSLVSNHAPPEAVEALRLIPGVTVKHYGLGGDTIERIRPGNLRRSDVVVTIGKTVQYALALGLTPYVYDRYGGPGYLSAANYDAARWHNFSGRCCKTVKRAAQIAEEIARDFDAARRFTTSLPDRERNRFRLEPYLDDLLAAVPSAPTTVERLAKLAPHALALKTERGVAIALGQYYREAIRLRRRRDLADLGESGPGGGKP